MKTLLYWTYERFNPFAKLLPYKSGHIALGYIDDAYLQADSEYDCLENIKYTIQIMTKLGFVIHEGKSVLTPTKEIVFLGFILNSSEMNVRLTPEKANRVYETCQNALQSHYITLQQLAEFIGLLVSSFPGFTYGPLYYRYLELDKIKGLRLSKGDYSALICLSKESKQE